MSQPPIIEALRGATAGAHKALEADIALFERVADPGRRRDLVARFHQLHASVEPAVEPWLADLPGLEFEHRRRADGIERDLADLDGLPLTAPPVTVASAAEALGWWYVLEGSSLGGRVIHRTLVGQGKDLQGLSFLHPYGADTGDWWRRFVEVLDAADRQTPGARGDILAGGVAGFRHAHEVLCGD